MTSEEKRAFIQRTHTEVAEHFQKLIIGCRIMALVSIIAPEGELDRMCAEAEKAQGVLANQQIKDTLIAAGVSVAAEAPTGPTPPAEGNA